MTNSSVLEFLSSRRSSKVTGLCEPAPSPEEIEKILEIGMRVPDHGKYCPWYFIVFEGEARKEAGELLRQAYQAENPEAAKAKLDLEAENFLRAPLVIAVVSRIREGKHSQWEQILSAGAACYNLCLAANSMGYGSNWLTQWYSYSDMFKKLMGLDKRDHFAGFIFTHGRHWFSWRRGLYQYLCITKADLSKPGFHGRSACKFNNCHPAYCPI